MIYSTDRPNEIPRRFTYPNVRRIDCRLRRCDAELGIWSVLCEIRNMAHRDRTQYVYLIAGRAGSRKRERRERRKLVGPYHRIPRGLLASPWARIRSI